MTMVGRNEKSSIQFANKVLNNFSPQGLVFGLDAPWGYGKSSYLNL